MSFQNANESVDRNTFACAYFLPSFDWKAENWMVNRLYVATDNDFICNAYLQVLRMASNMYVLKTLHLSKQFKKSYLNPFQQNKQNMWWVSKVLCKSQYAAAASQDV